VDPKNWTGEEPRRGTQVTVTAVAVPVAVAVEAEATELESDVAEGLLFGTLGVP
jgi:hypothetical protein